MVSSNIASVINSTIQQIDSGMKDNGALQMGPDGKIYFSKYGGAIYVTYLGAINYPELPGIMCSFVDSAVSLGGGFCYYGLPNFITSYFLPTGINTNTPQQNQLSVSPNPATDKINISFPVSSSQHITTKIFSVTGEVIFKEENKTGSNYFYETINVKNFSNGIYFLSMQGEKEMITKKVVVQH